MDEIREPIYDVNAFLAEDSVIQSLLGAVDSAEAFNRFIPLYEPANVELDVPYILYQTRTMPMNDEQWVVRERMMFIICDVDVVRAGKIQWRLYRLLGQEDRINVNHSYSLVEYPVNNDSSKGTYRFVNGKQHSTEWITPEQDAEVHKRHCRFDLSVIPPQAALTG